MRRTCPSEILALQWRDVNWAANRVTIRSEKTTHLGKTSRQIPLFPELKPYLEEAFDLADVGTTFVITHNRNPEKNYGTQFMRIIERAGLESWERLFHKLRASRQTELSDEFPAHVVCARMGNTEIVARQHYLSTLDKHFDKATQKATQLSPYEGKDSSQAVASPKRDSGNCGQMREGAANVRELANTTQKNRYPLGESNPCCRTENPES